MSDSGPRRVDLYDTTLRDGTQRGVGHDGDLADALVMVSYEAEVGRHRAEAVPAGKRGDLDDEPGEPARRFDVRIDCSRQLHEVVALER